MKFTVSSVLALLALCVSLPLANADSSADDGFGPSWSTGAMFYVGKPGALGGEGLLAMQFKPTAHALYIGPRMGALLAAADGGATRFDLSVGLAETIWIVNAIGSGIDLDAVFVTHLTGQDIPVNFRITPNLSIRTLPFGSEGAWAIRIRVPYDTHYKWGLQAGVTVQINDVARLGGD